MKRYLLFGYRDKPMGGLGDFVECFDNLQEAVDLGQRKYTFWHVLDRLEFLIMAYNESDVILEELMQDFENRSFISADDVEDDYNILESGR